MARVSDCQQKNAPKLLESRDASVPYDRDVNVIDIEEIRQTYGTITE